MSGKIIYVIGPSGAGKDSLMKWVLQHKSASMNFHWAKRIVTRHPTEGEGTDEYVSAESFEKLLSSHMLAMHWSAHDIEYGILKSDLLCIESDTMVFINGSRSYLSQAIELFPKLCAVHITASAKTLEQRLYQRARESQDKILARLSRPELARPDLNIPWLEMLNEGSLEDGGNKILSFLNDIKNCH
ncbi:MAG: phosphonate metabolism protein/1,5-bisphosphokinase (PRPP-forming) PhnN [Burkholderiaceae bacterium]